MSSHVHINRRIQIGVALIHLCRHELMSSKTSSTERCTHNGGINKQLTETTEAQVSANACETKPV